MVSCPHGGLPRFCRGWRIKRLGEKLNIIGSFLEETEEIINQDIENLIKEFSQELIELQAIPSAEETIPRSEEITPIEVRNRIISQRLTAMSIEGSRILTETLTISMDTNVSQASTEEGNNISTDILITPGETVVAPESTEIDVSDNPTNLLSPRTEELIEPLTKLLRQMLIG
ncbi:hypothetical protein NIES2119_16315 [[Phormidium ambiguum] IAM M-71]|uniref:Uncharacterized protein n=1 Tax=[Phormidium ambiguum] IAM M-71 TaxID=454136 RepID=A0A1U7IHR9_9CYAN|nr:hypothetical protein [Phormidium ambiguum]OKH36594.1 hypothetical protein NIES2119_16315 [Phormidium ambiguum IAM M-71]